MMVQLEDDKAYRRAQRRFARWVTKQERKAARKAARQTQDVTILNFDVLKHRLPDVGRNSNWTLTL